MHLVHGHRSRLFDTRDDGVKKGRGLPYVVDLVQGRAPGAERFCLIVLQASISQEDHMPEERARTTYLTLKIDGCRADEVALVVGLLHGRRGLVAHHNFFCLLT